MAGYYGYSMSNNAVEAYASGEKPLSKWTKKDIIDGIKKEGMDLQCNIDLLKKLPVAELRNLCLYNSSWHHTSNHFNHTDFYSLHIESIEDLTDADLLQVLEDIKIEKSKSTTDPIEEKWKCAFLEWSGTRKHPTPTEIVEEGIVRGNWFIRKDGSKKKISSNGFRFIEKLE